MFDILDALMFYLIIDSCGLWTWRDTIAQFRVIVLMKAELLAHLPLGEQDDGHTSALDPEAQAQAAEQNNYFSV
jgi:hypothetical protein